MSWISPENRSKNLAGMNRYTEGDRFAITGTHCEYQITNLTISAKTSEEVPGILPLAACWGHSAGVRFEDLESSDAITVKDYSVLKVPKELEDFRGRKEEKRGLCKDDQRFCSLLTRPVMQNTKSTLKCHVEGKDFSGESHPGMTSTMMLGILDAATGEMEILPFRDVFPHMRMDPQKPTEPQTIHDQTPEAPRRIISEFSSKFKKRRHNEHKSSSTKVHHDTSLLLPSDDKKDEDISHLLTNTSPTAVDLSSGEGLRPPPNIEAKTPEELYAWDQIVPSLVLVSLEKLSNEVIETMATEMTTWEKERKFSTFALELLKGLPKEVEDKSLKVAMILCIDCLFGLFHKKSPAPDRALLPQYLTGVPGRAANYFLKEFTAVSLMNSKMRNILSKSKDKIMAHLLLLALRLGDYSMDITTLMAAVSDRDRKKIQLLAMIIGAKIAEKSAKHVASYILTLKHPWNFPKKSTGTPRKRKQR